MCTLFPNLGIIPYLCFKIENKYKLYTVIYFVIVASIFIIVGMWYPFGALVLLLLSNIVKCIYRITYVTKIIK